MTSVDPTHRYRLLYDLGCAFAAQIELHDLVPLVVAKCRETFDAEGASLLLLDGETNELYFPWVASDDAEAVARLATLRFPADRGIAGAVLGTGRPLRIDDVAADARHYGGADRTTGLATRTLICAPLRSHLGALGVVQVVNRRGDGCFTDDDLSLLEALAGSVGIAIENARLYAGAKASAERLRAEVGALRREQARRDRFTEIIGTGAAMAGVFRLMESAATSPITVLIEGETGTGKELVARGIHRAGPRADGPFLAVNCAAMPETLLESELFGHRKGAFTGATQDQRGLFEAAAGGTLLLDEVGEMPAAMQAKLLRVLQEGEIVPLGDTRPRKVDVRVVSATNRDLTVEVAERRFREDLYYRLAAFPIRLPPLRERREDIPLLASRFLTAAAERHRKQVRGIAPEAMDPLLRFQWPGNVRELQNEIERATALASDGETIVCTHLSAKLVAGSAPRAEPESAGESLPAGEPSRDRGPLRRARAAFEAHYITETLRREGGNVTRAAQALGLSRVMLQKKMKEYNLR